MMLALIAFGALIFVNIASIYLVNKFFREWPDDGGPE
jgi:hypothetical protein